MTTTSSDQQAVVAHMETTLRLCITNRESALLCFVNKLTGEKLFFFQSISHVCKPFTATLLQHYPVGVDTDICPYILSVADLALTDEQYFKCMDSRVLSLFLVVDQQSSEWEVMNLTYLVANCLAELTVSNQTLVDVAAEEEVARAIRASKRAMKCMMLGLEPPQAKKRRTAYIRRGSAQRRRQACYKYMCRCVRHNV